MGAKDGTRRRAKSTNRSNIDRDGPLRSQGKNGFASHGLDLTGLLGADVSAEDVTNELSELTSQDLFSSMFAGFADMQLGKTDFIKELNNITTDEDLLAFVETYFHIRVPYVPVCEDHQSPGQAFCDVFFNRAPEALWWASRASFKSFGTGLLTVLDSMRYRMCETRILAGSQEQGNNVYAAAETHIYSAGLDKQFNMRRNFTSASNGSHFSVLTASPKSARGPHPQRLKLDEVDEIPREIYNAAVNQPMAKHGVPMGTLMTSTMHKVYGLMSEIVDEAPKTGLKVYKWCYKEVTQQCVEPDCRSLVFSDRFRGEACPLLGLHVQRVQDLPEDERVRLVPAETYVVKPGDEPVLLDAVDGYYDGSCQGELRRASGYVPVDDQRVARQRVPTSTWNVENECRRPSQEDMVYDPVLLQRSVIADLIWDETIDNTRTWAMCDWGYNNPTALLLAQERVVPGKPLKNGPYHHCVVGEYYWEQRGLSWRVEQICNILEDKNIRQFYADAENVDALMAVREELAQRNHKCLVRGVPFNRFKEPLIELVRADMEHGHFFISSETCPNTIRDLFRLHYRQNTEDVAKEDDHGPDALLAGWRRFIKAGEIATTSGYDVGSAMTIREIARPVTNAHIPGITINERTPLALPAGSPVGVTIKRKETKERARRY